MFYSKWWFYKNVYLPEVKKQQIKKYLKQVRNKTKPLFIHINKTAGSSIAKSLDITETHLTLREYEERYQNLFNEELPLDIEIWTAIRNPFDKVSSEYFYRIKHNQNNMKSEPIEFDEWIKQAYDEKNILYRDREIMFKPHLNWIDSDREYTFNFIRFESLYDDYNKLRSKFDGKPLVWKKKSSNSNYKEMYSDYSKSVIEKEFKIDLDRFNYSY